MQSKGLSAFIGIAATAGLFTVATQLHKSLNKSPKKMHSELDSKVDELYSFSKQLKLEDKSILRQSACDSNAYLIHTQQHPDLYGIKIRRYHDIDTKQFIVAFIDKQHKKQYYHVTDEKQVEKITRLIDISIKENKLELMSDHPVGLSDLCILNPGYWEKWDENPQQKIYYESVNDPAVMDAIEKYVLPLKDSINEPLTILDIGSGKGRLAKKIIQFAKLHKIDLHYIVVEPSLSQFKIAEEYLKTEANDNCKITFINSTIEAMQTHHLAHAIISSGGPLNAQIVTREQALKSLEIMKSRLAPDGILIASGLSELMIRGKHFASNNLQVLSYADIVGVLPGEIEENPLLAFEIKQKCSFFPYIQRYICKNIANEKKQLPAVGGLYRLL